MFCFSPPFPRGKTRGIFLSRKILGFPRIFSYNQALVRLKTELLIIIRVSLFAKTELCNCLFVELEVCLFEIL